MIDHVIVPIDGSENADRALLPAIDVARRFDAGLIFLQAAHPDEIHQAEEQLQERVLRSRVEDAEIVVDTLNGPVGALVELIDERPRSLVCMTTHGRGGLGRALFGSVAEEALQQVEVAFLLVGPNSDLTRSIRGPVLVPLDGSHRSESILPVATEWCRTLGVGLWVVSVIDPADAERVHAEGGDLAEAAYVERVARALPEDLPTVNWEVLRSADPAHAIAEFAEERECSVVAMATHGRTGLARVALGSVAARVVHDHQGVTLVIRTASAEGED